MAEEILTSGAKFEECIENIAVRIVPFSANIYDDILFEAQQPLDAQVGTIQRAVTAAHQKKKDSAFLERQKKSKK